MALFQTLFTFTSFHDYAGNFAGTNDYNLGNPYSDCNNGNGIVAVLRVVALHMSEHIVDYDGAIHGHV
jgi:hypothetical protein